MRQSPMTRLLLILAIVFAGALAAAVQAAPPAQEVEPAQAGAPARVAVVHAAPFAANTTVSVVVNDAILLDNNFTLGEVVTYLTLPAATYNIKVYAGSVTLPVPAGTTPVLNVSPALAAGTDYTFAVVGNSVSPTAPFPVQILALTDTPGAPGSATAKLRVVHGAAIGNSVAATAVDVIPDTGTPTNLIPNAARPFTFGKDTGFLDVPAGAPLNFKVVAAGTTDPALIDLPPVTFNTGDVNTIIAVGAPTVPFIVLPAPARAQAEVRIVHAAPFSATSTAVTIRLGDTPVVGSFSFGQQTPYLPVAPGIYTLQVFAGPTASGTPVLTETLVVQDGKSYTALAVGTNAAPFPLDVIVTDDTFTPPGSSTALVRVIHAAPLGTTVAGTAVDVIPDAGGNSIIPAANRPFVFGTVTPYLALPAGSYNLKVTPAGQPGTTLIDLPEVALATDQVVTVVAVGGANGQSGRVLVLDDRTATFPLFLPLVPRQQPAS